MRRAWSYPREERSYYGERPFLEAPSPFDYAPMSPPRSEEDKDDEERPRVIIIDI